MEFNCFKKEESNECENELDEQTIEQCNKKSNWNARFQNAVHTIRNFSGTETSFFLVKNMLDSYLYIVVVRVNEW